MNVKRTILVPLLTIVSLLFLAACENEPDTEIGTDELREEVQSLREDFDAFAEDWGGFREEWNAFQQGVGGND